MTACGGIDEEQAEAACDDMCASYSVPGGSVHVEEDEIECVCFSGGPTLAQCRGFCDELGMDTAELFFTSAATRPTLAGADGCRCRD